MILSRLAQLCYSFVWFGLNGDLSLCLASVIWTLVSQLVSWLFYLCGLFLFPAVLVLVGVVSWSVPWYNVIAIFSMEYVTTSSQKAS